MKKLVFLFLFFFFGVFDVFSHYNISPNEVFSIKGKNYYFRPIEGGFAIYDLDTQSQVKEYSVYNSPKVDLLYYDTGAEKFYFNQYGNYFYIDENLDFINLPNPTGYCPGDYKIYNNLKHYCYNYDSQKFDGFAYLTGRFLFGNPAFAKIDGDNITIRGYKSSGNNIQVTDFTYNAGPYISTHYDSIHISGDKVFGYSKGDNGNYNSFSYDFSTKDLVYNKDNLVKGDSSYIYFNYSYGNKYTIKTSESNKKQGYFISNVGGLASGAITGLSSSGSNISSSFTGNTKIIPGFDVNNICYEYDSDSLPSCSFGVLFSSSSNGVKKGTRLSCSAGINTKEFIINGYKTFTFFNFSGGEYISTCGYINNNNSSNSSSVGTGLASGAQSGVDTVVGSNTGTGLASGAQAGIDSVISSNIGSSLIKGINLGINNPYVIDYINDKKQHCKMFDDSIKFIYKFDNSSFSIVDLSLNGKFSSPLINSFIPVLDLFLVPISSSVNQFISFVSSLFILPEGDYCFLGYSYNLKYQKIFSYNNDDFKRFFPSGTHFFSKGDMTFFDYIFLFIFGIFLVKFSILIFNNNN